ncbi:hypothetical protein ElyMa_005270900 [Elysia marginata]|uniref:Hedgehog N-terminal signalling domain-containing protein n=1 Tax=Elysia marginata TaxID=1093978 RepID=A0AAV4JXM7_9GAST|nr:hypothetical protein ElyMa_005270900 [Elysia marginata]
MVPVRKYFATLGSAVSILWGFFGKSDSHKVNKREKSATLDTGLHASRHRAKGDFEVTDLSKYTQLRLSDQRDKHTVSIANRSTGKCTTSTSLCSELSVTPEHIVTLAVQKRPLCKRGDNIGWTGNSSSMPGDSDASPLARWFSSSAWVRILFELEVVAKQKAHAAINTTSRCESKVRIILKAGIFRAVPLKLKLA